MVIYVRWVQVNTGWSTVPVLLLPVRDYYSTVLRYCTILLHSRIAFARRQYSREALELEKLRREQAELDEQTMLEKRKTLDSEERSQVHAQFLDDASDAESVRSSSSSAAAEFLFCRFRRFREITSFLCDRLIGCHVLMLRSPWSPVSSESRLLVVEGLTV
jgi:hypothetical protein